MAKDINTSGLAASLSEVETLLSFIDSANKVAADARKAFTDAETANAEAQKDDGTLSALELVDKRQAASRNLELCRIESERAQKSCGLQITKAVAVLTDLGEKEKVRLYDLATGNVDVVMAKLGELFEDDDERTGAFSSYNIRNFAMASDAVAKPFAIAGNLDRARLIPGTEARMQTYVSLLKKAAAWV